MKTSYQGKNLTEFNTPKKNIWTLQGIAPRSSLEYNEGLIVTFLIKQIG